MEDKIKALEEKVDLLYKAREEALKRSTPWDSAMRYARQHMKQESIFALVKTLQRLIDEKSKIAMIHEKATTPYTDRLYGKILSSVTDNVNQRSQEVVTDIILQVTDAQKEVAELRQFIYRRLHEIDTVRGELEKRIEEVTTKLSKERFM